MRVIWELSSPFSISDISSTYPYTTVASIVKKLQIKGYISNNPLSKKENKHMYKIVISKENYILNKLNRLFTDFCNSNSLTFGNLVIKVLSGTNRNETF